MRRLELSFVSRVKVLLIVGSANAGEGGIDKLVALSAVRRKVEFTDEEWERISVLDAGGPVTYTAVFGCPSCGATTMRDSGRGYVCTACRAKEKDCPEPEFARVTLDLEEAEASWLRRRLQEWLPNAGVGDEVWFGPVMEALAPKVEPRMEFKRGKRR